MRLVFLFLAWVGFSATPRRATEEPPNGDEATPPEYLAAKRCLSLRPDQPHALPQHNQCYMIRIRRAIKLCCLNLHSCSIKHEMCTPLTQPVVNSSINFVPPTVGHPSVNFSTTWMSTTSHRYCSSTNIFHQSYKIGIKINITQKSQNKMYSFSTFFDPHTVGNTIQTVAWWKWSEGGRELH